MLEVKAICDMCGQKEITVGVPNDFPLKPRIRDLFTRLIEEAGWVVQINGEHFDTYCSKRCAQ